MGDPRETAPDCEQVTVGMVPQARAAVARAAARKGLSQTDVINRACIAYGFLDEQLAAGTRVLIEAPDGTVYEARFS